jgi:uncharacterized membrane protein YgaE (UPF0421/DUF939 family)
LEITAWDVIQTGVRRSQGYCVGAVVVAVFSVFFFVFAFVAFVAFVFFVFSVFVVSCVPVSCANTGIASENATANVNSSVRSFFMSGLDLLRDYFLL